MFASGWTIPLEQMLMALAFGYLLGSIPFGLILTRLSGAGDIRQIGSGNIGATNVLRTGRKGLAAATLLGDALKGTAAVVIAGRYGPEPALLAGFAAFMGHLFPVWLRFKGGKGVATFLGVLIGIAWPGAIVFAVVPSVQSVFWIFSAMAVQLYLIMYMVMFLAAMRLRRTHADVPRGFRVPWLPVVGWVGFAASAAAFLIGFVEPSSSSVGPIGYVAFLVGGIVVLGIWPFVLYAMR